MTTMMTIKEKYQKDMWYVLQRIKDGDLRRVESEGIEYKIEIDPSRKNAPEPNNESRMIRQLLKLKAIKELEPSQKVKSQVSNFTIRASYFYYLKIIPKKFNELYLQYELLASEETKKQSGDNSLPVKIKNIHLKKKDYILEINNGAEMISFKSKKDKHGLEKETKQFKIFFHLWDFRKEIASNQITRNGGWVSLDNLAKPLDMTEKSVYQHIKRIRKKFKDKKVLIDIKSSKTGKYRIVVHRS